MRLYDTAYRDPVAGGPHASALLIAGIWAALAACGATPDSGTKTRGEEEVTATRARAAWYSDSYLLQVSDAFEPRAAGLGSTGCTLSVHPLLRFGNSLIQLANVIDLAVSQNGSRTRLFRNRGARPGLRVRLAGPARNPDGIGATVRVVYADGLGPAREIRSGAGYWSSDDPVQILGLAGDPVAVRVRWSWGEEWDVPLQPDQREITIGAR